MIKITPFFLILVLLPITNSFAIDSSQERAVIREIEINQQRLGRERLDIIKNNKKQEIEKIRENRNLEKTDYDIENFDDKGGCVNLKKIDFSGNTIFSNKIIRSKLLSEFDNKCLKKADLIRIKQKLENFYIVKGYSNCRVYFDKEKLKEKILFLMILEGFTQKISLKNNSKIDKKLKFRNSNKLFFAFPFLNKKIFNIRDFEQGLDQINRLQSSKATMTIEPGNERGLSKVLINNNISHPTNITLSYDNSGQESTGKNKRKLAISQDNLFGIYDNLYINYSEDDDPNHNQKFSKNIYSAFSVPFGYWTFLSSYSKAQYFATINDQNNSYNISGQTLSKTFQLDKTLIRGQAFKTKLGTELNLKDTKSFSQNTINSVGTHKLSILTIFNENSFYTKKGTIFLKPSLVQGLDIFDARSDTKDITSNEAHAQYKLARLYGYYNTQFNIPKSNIPLNYLLTFDSQLSQDSLYGTEKFSIGDRYSVRGFDENSISGDNGYYVRNDLKINNLYLFPEKLLSSKFFSFNRKNGLSVTNFLSKSYFSVFYDYGYVRNKNIISEAGEGYMSGAGIKFDYLGKFLNWDISFSKGLKSPKFIETIYQQAKDEETLYFNISAALGLF